jgi:hypothetical protein
MSRGDRWGHWRRRSRLMTLLNHMGRISHRRDLLLLIMRGWR